MRLQSWTRRTSQLQQLAAAYPTQPSATDATAVQVTLPSGVVAVLTGIMSVSFPSRYLVVFAFVVVVVVLLLLPLLLLLLLILELKRGEKGTCVCFSTAFCDLLPEFFFFFFLSF